MRLTYILLPGVLYVCCCSSCFDECYCFDGLKGAWNLVESTRLIFRRRFKYWSAIFLRVVPWVPVSNYMMGKCEVANEAVGRKG